MALFSIHLLGRDGRVAERRNVRAIRNYEAIEIAAALCDAKSCAGYEVWRGGRRIAQHRAAGPGPGP